VDVLPPPPNPSPEESDPLNLLALVRGIFYSNGDESLGEKTIPLTLQDRQTGDLRDRPMNFTRVETFGSPDVHRVRSSVDTRGPEVFSFQPEMVEEDLTGQTP
jgi:hypothetical protein